VAPDEAPAPNAFERRRWNDAYWSSTWPEREQLTSAATPAMLEHLGAAAGERILDVGSGAGAAAIAVARAVAPSGEVVGADVSEPLLAFARRRADDEGVANVRFVSADVQLDRIEGAPFTAAMSQFGVMFFEDPVTAFGNVRAHLCAGARLVFVCWQSARQNPWFAGHALRDLLPAPAPPAPGHHATGPFAFGELGEAERLLDAAGWEEVEVAAIASSAVVTRAAIADDGQAAFMGVDADRLDEARDALDAHLAPFERPDGRLEVPIAFFVVTARTPR
jgi:SAM-dependent methyltransferase